MQPRSRRSFVKLHKNETILYKDGERTRETVARPHADYERSV